ncbi:MAG: beta-galactosidase [Promethearchaeota archaeon]
MQRPTNSNEESSGPVHSLPKIDRNCLRFGESFQPLYSGSIDYWRAEKEEWPNLLERVKGLGFRIITTSVPWNVHEKSIGQFDFGAIDERNDLEGFLTLCKEKGFYVITRIGPSINAELLNFGYPSRIIKDKDLLAQSAQGTLVIIPATPLPFPMPSYANEKFYDEVTRYFDVLCPILVRQLAPSGPLIGAHIDNELSLIFMHGAFGADYSPSSISWYHEFLSGKYASIGSLNRAYRTRYNRFPEVEPPRALATRDREALPRYFDWIEFQEYYIVLSLSVLASLLWARGMRGIITQHNIRSVYPRLPLNVTRVERELDIQGVGLYLGRSDYDLIRRGALYMTAKSCLPYIAEASMGVWPWGPTLRLEDQQFALFAALMFGFRGFNIHMLVERNRWVGSPISRRGELSDRRHGFLQQLLRVLDNLEFHSLQRPVNVLLSRNLEYERLLSLCCRSNWIISALGFPSECLVSDYTFGNSEAIQQAYPAFFDAFYWGLTRTKIPFLIGDTEMDRPALSKFQAMFLPTYDYMSEGLQRKLLEYVDRGGTAIIGPEIPYLGSDMRPCTILTDETELKPIKSMRPLVGLHDPLQLESGEVHVGNREAGLVVPHGRGKFIYLRIIFPPITDRHDAIDAENVVNQTLQGLELNPVGDLRATFVDEAYWGKRGTRAIFLINPTNQPRSVEVQVPQRAVLRDAWTGEQLSARGPQEIELLPYATRILEVLR